MKRTTIALAILLTAVLAVVRIRAQSSSELPQLMLQTQAEADAKSAGCLSCHHGIEPMHASAAVKLACTDCHGGNGPPATKDTAHVKPLPPPVWKTSANPPRPPTALPTQPRPH